MTHCTLSLEQPTADCMNSYTQTGTAPCLMVQHWKCQATKLVPAVLSRATRCSQPLGTVSAVLSRATRCSQPLGTVSAVLSRATRSSQPLGTVPAVLSRATRCSQPLGTVPAVLSRAVRRSQPLGTVTRFVWLYHMLVSAGDSAWRRVTVEYKDRNKVMKD